MSFYFLVRWGYFSNGMSVSCFQRDRGGSECLCTDCSLSNFYLKSTAKVAHFGAACPWLLPYLNFKFLLCFIANLSSKDSISVQHRTPFKWPHPKQAHYPTCQWSLRPFILSPWLTQFFGLIHSSDAVPSLMLCLYTEGINRLNLPRTVIFQSQLHVRIPPGRIKIICRLGPNARDTALIDLKGAWASNFFKSSPGDSNIKPRFRATHLELAYTFGKD